MSIRKMRAHPPQAAVAVVLAKDATDAWIERRAIRVPRPVGLPRDRVQISRASKSKGR